MSRILLLVSFLLWLAGTSDGARPAPESPWACLALFFAFYALLVATMRLVSQAVARRVATTKFGRLLTVFNWTMFAARAMVPAWLGVGIFVLGWAGIVDDRLGLGRLGTTRLPSTLLGTLPAMLAWVGLWWSQYPADRALREQNMLVHLGEDMPMRAPPGFGEYFASNLRLQLLFTVAPILLTIVVRDAIGIAVVNHLPGRAHAVQYDDAGVSAAAPDTDDDPAEVFAWLASAAIVFVVAPEALRRILKTRPFPDGPLRRRLDAVCRRGGVRYRQILYWDTGQGMGNAAVMGLIPWMRYILLSDVLVETMSDDQIEAVFAHEVGHVVHRHMAWFCVFFGVLFTASWCVETVIENSNWFGASALIVASLGLSAAGFWLGFGFLSRRFERQADVYAARTIQQGRELAQSPVDAPCPRGIALAPVAGPAISMEDGPGFLMGVGALGSVGGARQVEKAGDDPEDRSSFVGHYGATLFGSALHRVARINNIPIAQHEWLHGSIARRMQYLRDLSADPALTSRFDRVMVRIYCGLVFALVACVVWWATVH